jgi:hypothetical protein
MPLVSFVQLNGLITLHFLLFRYFVGTGIKVVKFEETINNFQRVFINQGFKFETKTCMYDCTLYTCS